MWRFGRGAVKIADRMEEDRMTTEHISKKDNFLSAAILKNIAYISMLIDHFSCVILIAYMQWKIWQGFTVDVLYEVYQWGRAVGRIAFILFAFMAAEGFVYTHDRRRYLLRLGIFALLSEIPFDLAIHGTFFTMKGQNVYFTLFLGVLALYLVGKLQGHFFWQMISVASCCIVAILLDTDYMIMGVLLIVIFYLTRKSFWYQFVAGSLTIYFGIVAVYAIDYWNGIQGLPWLFRSGCGELYGLFAFILIYFYNGKKGKQLPKSAYYFFYPMHLLILYGIKVVLFG